MGANTPDEPIESRRYRNWVGIVMPWTDDERLDAGALERTIARLAENGMEGIYIFGTTGEFYAVDDGEFEEVAAAFTGIMRAYPDVPCQIGCGTCSLRQTLKRIGIARRLGCRTVQLVLPYWMIVTDAEALAYFKAICAAHPDAEVVLYDNPDGAGRAIGTGLFRRLIEEVPNLVGAKVIGLDAKLIAAIHAVRPAFDVYAVEDTFVTLWDKGVNGLLSWCNYAFPKLIGELYEAVKAGDVDGIGRGREQFETIQNRIKAPFRAAGYHDSPMDRLMGLASGFLAPVYRRVRAPYRSVDPADVARARELIARHLGSEYLVE